MAVQISPQDTTGVTTLLLYKTSQLSRQLSFIQENFDKRDKKNTDNLPAYTFSR
jgi:hypothetical protein